MKKLLVVLLSVLMVLSVAACSAKEEGGNEEGGNVKVDELNIAFVPSKDAQEILDAAEPLKEILKTQLAGRGFDVETVNISVGSNYEVVGEGLQAGSIDLGFIPAGNYVTAHDQYPDDVNLLLVASRTSLNVDIESPSKGADFEDWNKGPTSDLDTPSGGYRSLIYVNVATEKGADLYAKAVAGTLKWEDMYGIKVLTGSVTSGASYMYPSAWLNDKFSAEVGKPVTLADLEDGSGNVVKGAGYADNMEALLAGQCEMCFGYADVRKDEASTTSFENLKAQGLFEGYETVFDAIKCIGVSDFIMNDTISYGSDEKLTPDFVKALQDSFIDLMKTEEGKACVKPYDHAGYVVGTDADYNGTRAVSKLFNN